MRMRARIEAHDQGHLVAVHIGRLGAGEDLDAIADAPGIARLRLDIGMLDEGGLEDALGHRLGLGHGRGRHRPS